MKMRTLAASGLLFVAAPAWAGESLINGSPLRYNFEYHCKGERMVVSRCRDNDDASYCQVYYPDRPYHNGMMVQPVEMRGDIVAKLSACERAASAPNVPARSSAAPTRKAANTGTAPGLGKARWQMLDFDEQDAIYFTKARMKRTGNLADGWFTTVFVRPKDIAAAGLADIQFFQARYSANCSQRTTQVREGAYFDEDGKLLTSRVIDDGPVRHPAAGSVGEEQFNVLCGKPQRLAEPTTFDGDGDFLVFFYLELLHERQAK